jgi:hypothetical protein
MRHTKVDFGLNISSVLNLKTGFYTNLQPYRPNSILNRNYTKFLSAFKFPPILVLQNYIFISRVEYCTQCNFSAWSFPFIETSISSNI